MKKAADYKRHADHCRRLAAAARAPEHKSMLLEMASTWEALAQARTKHIARQEKIADLETIAQQLLASAGRERWVRPGEVKLKQKAGADELQGS